MEYIVVTSTSMLSPEKLEKSVNEKIREGFAPIGGVGLTSDRSHTYFYQAMIRETLMLKCNECGCDMEKIDDNSFGCNNEDCTNEIFISS